MSPNAIIFGMLTESSLCLLERACCKETLRYTARAWLVAWTASSHWVKLLFRRSRLSLRGTEGGAISGEIVKSTLAYASSCIMESVMAVISSPIDGSDSNFPTGPTRVENSWSVIWHRSRCISKCCLFDTSRQALNWKSTRQSEERRTNR